MRSKLIILLIFLGLFPLSVQLQKVEARQVKQSESLRELINITRQIYDAGIKGNKNILDRYLDESFLETDAYGKLHDKAGNLQNIWRRVRN